MSPATSPRSDPSAERLLVVDTSTGALVDRVVGDLPALLEPGDVLVVNDGATLPASLTGRTQDGAALEARLVTRNDDGSFSALLFGSGSWRVVTEQRGPAPAVDEGAMLAFDGISAMVTRVSPSSPRLVDLRFDRAGAAMWRALYAAGRPIQYAYVARPLDLWDVQTRYASRPWCAEMPSAGRPLSWDVLLELRRRGVVVARITHAAGLSSTGDAALDALLPMRERYDVPDDTVRAIAEAKARGGRVIAAGTTVARALEGAALANGGELAPGSGTTDLLLGDGHRLRVVDALLTGMHEPSESHYRLLEAFAPKPLVAAANARANDAGYLTHEFGDSSLIIALRRAA